MAMRLHIIGSSSKGNCYVLENDRMALILEAGVNIKEVKKVLDFNVSKIVACLITHEHGDHSGHVKSFLEAGIDVYTSAGTIKALKIDHHRLHPLSNMKKVIVKSFSILPFDVKHDCAEPLGFLVDHPDTGTFVFATDTYYIPYKFQDLNNILIECNYSKAILNANIEKGLNQVVRDRVVESHMELNTCTDFLLANDLSKVNNIVLLHLSDGNSNAEQFKAEVENLTGKTVHIADKDMIINLNKRPF